MAQPNQSNQSQQQSIPTPKAAEQPKAAPFNSSMIMFERVIMASIPEARRVSTKAMDGHNASKIELDNFSGLGLGLIGLVVTDPHGHKRLVPWSRVDLVDLD